MKLAKNQSTTTKKLYINLILASATILIANNSFADNSIPCGAGAVMEYLAGQNNYASAEAMFNTALFSNADGACKKGNSQTGVDCTQAMYTYQGFVAASQNFPTFACQGNLADRVRDLAGFFANVAQETYGGDGTHYDNTGGLFWRIENNGLPNANYDPNNAAVGINDFVDTSGDTTSYCPQGPGSSGVYSWDTTGALYYDANWSALCPSNYTPMTPILGSGNWTGHGAIQLTGDSIFFGTQVYNTVTKNSLTVPQFANALINNDQVSWFSAIAYWTVSKPNQSSTKPAEYYVITDQDPNFGFGKSVYMVNGGCNQSTQRLAFFEYFEKQLSGNITDAQDNETQAQLQCQS